MALSVYQRNVASVAFYQQQGFEIIAQDEEPLTGQAQFIMNWQDM
ncbi:hypothetical protein [Pseudoalteromonas luteoviolacea]|uniref:N-acetyltransferase domain-containing protein n=1 Tax=Pseudoalteromonas luteoviolacea S4054 TaxID=1129367 RepID=A0A0F6AEC6_9GAMM|nr:hypothetical protein [Pseudoalteromonas luteoviolacea]KKE84567.1 hypothetical protein N479_08355 [Pseudoalteromonas luteoviolacea S4054]KZN71288.1 hypothetical protein N481_19065 [Pseudoalteromonas luteoviolacea S4047-1]